MPIHKFLFLKEPTSSSISWFSMSRSRGRSSSSSYKKYNYTKNTKKSSYVRYSTLFHLAAPLGFHCVGGCWDRTQYCSDLTLIVRRSKHSARSHPLSATPHPHSARSHPHSATSHLLSLDLIHTRLDLIHIRLDLIKNSARSHQKLG